MPKRWPAAGTLLTLVAQALLVAWIYAPTWRLAFASDAWSYLERLRQGFVAATATPIGYHWQPVAVAWIAVIRGAFGEDAAAFQVVNLVQLTLIAHLTFQLGKRLLADTQAAFLASLLVAGSAACYEATYWPLAGNMHLLAALFYVLSTVIAHDVATGRLGRGGPWLLGLTVVAAMFSHPAMVTSLVVCALILVFAGGRPRMRAPLLALAVAAMLFVAARIVFHASLEAAPRPGFEPLRVIWLVRRGILPAFSLRGSLDVLDRMMTLGAGADTAARVWVGAGGWLAASALAAGLCLWRARSNGVRLLVAFLAVHAAALTVAGGMSPRQTVVLTVPAALLTACALRAAAGGLAARAGRGTRAALAHALPAAVVALLIAGAQPDHRTALELHLRVADGWRALVARLRAVPGDRPFHMTLINMPASLSARGMGAFAFQNGLGEMAHLTNPAVTWVDLWRVPIRGAPAHIVAEVPWLTRAGLREQLADPDRVVLFYEDDPVDVQPLTPADADRLAARWWGAPE